MSEGISIYHTPDGKEWANYLKEKLSSEEYNITTNLKDFETAPSDIDTKVNVFVITPDFIKLDNWNLMNYFDTSTSLAILTGVLYQDWSAAVLSHNIDSLNDWCYHELLGENLDGSVRELIVLIISLYENNELEPEEETYINIPADVKLPGKTRKVLPPKKKESVVSIPGDIFELSEYKDSNKDEESVSDLKGTEETGDKNEDDPYRVPGSVARPVNTVRYVFRQGEYVYVLLEDTNCGLVQVKFHEDDSVVTAACVSEKTTVYSFLHKRTERETFDVTLDGIEIGYGIIEKDAERPRSGVSEDSYDYPRLCRGSVISTTSGSSSWSSRSSTTGKNDQPPPCSNKPVGSGYINSPRSCADSSEPSDVKFSLPSSPLTRDSVYETPKSWTGSDRDTLSESSTVKPSGSTSKLDQIQKLLEDVTDPVNVLCQSLQAENPKHLDEKLTFMLQSTEALKHLSFKTSLDTLPDRCDTLCPTLMHFGAKFNLKIFCKFLLDSPITRNCAVKRNRNGDYPHDIARQESHVDLARMLENVALQLQSSKSGLHDSGISLCTPVQSPMSPPVRDSLNLYMDMSAKSPPPEHPSTSPAKSILKKSSQVSLPSDEEDYEVPISLKTGVTGNATQELTVTLGPSVYIADDDNDKTPVPRGSVEQSEPPFDDIIEHRGVAEGNLSQRESNGIENPFHTPVNRSSSGSEEWTRTNRKDLKSIFGIQPSASVPSELQQTKKPGMFGKVFGKKDKSRTLSNPKITAETMDAIQGKPHIGQKTHVFRRDLMESDPSSEQFRSRLQTYPGPGQALSRPNLKHLKTKYKLDKNQSSSIENLVATGVGGTDSPLAQPPSPCSRRALVEPSTIGDPHFQRHMHHHYAKRSGQPEHGASDREPHSSREKEGFKREKRKSDKKDKNKKKVQLTITTAQKRASMRLHHARQDPVESAPALPPRPPPKLKPLGAF